MKITHSFGGGADNNGGSSSKVKNNNLLHLEWQYSGEQCTGYYHMKTSTLTLNFILRNACVTFIYRIIDNNTIRSNVSIKYEKIFKGIRICKEKLICFVCEV